MSTPEEFAAEFIRLSFVVGDMDRIRLQGLLTEMTRQRDAAHPGVGRGQGVLGPETIEACAVRAGEVIRREIPCRCIDAYRDRDMVDPNCAHHDAMDILTDIRALAVQGQGARREDDGIRAWWEEEAKKWSAECDRLHDAMEETIKALGQWKCLLCNGSGRVPSWRYDIGAAVGEVQCRTCKGDGLYFVARTAIEKLTPAKHVCSCKGPGCGCPCHRAPDVRGTIPSQPPLAPSARPPLPATGAPCERCNGKRRIDNPDRQHLADPHRRSYVQCPACAPPTGGT